MKIPFSCRYGGTVSASLILGAVSLFSLGLPGRARESDSIPAQILSPENVNQWATVMSTNHPALRAAQARARAATLNVQGVRQFADPRFLIGGSVYGAKGMDSAEEGNLVYGVEQSLPLLGKESAARAVAQAQAETESARTDARFQELRRDLAVALFEAALARRAVELAEVDQAWVEEIARNLESRLATGTSTQVEVLRLQTELAQRKVEVENLRSRELEALAVVNRRLGRDPQIALPRFQLPEPAQPIRYNDRLVQLALGAEPRLRILATERHTAGAVVEATRRSQRPNLAVGVDGRQYGGDGDFRGGTFFLSVSLPLWNRSKFRQDLARDRERLRAAEDDQADTALAVREEIHHITLRLDIARREALLYQDEILPRAERTYRASLAQWSAGRGDLRDVLESHRTVLAARLQFSRAVAEQWTALSELVLCCGLGDLEALEMLNELPAEPADAEPRSTTP